jgi:periplasmic protein CpxP/Spy
MHKHCFVVMTLAALTCLSVSSVAAQDNGNSQPPAQAGEPSGQQWHGHGRMDPEKRTEMLTKKLKLNSDQQAKVLDIFKSEQSQMESLHSDSSMSQDDRHSKMMEIHKTSNDQVRALLDENQQKKWDAMQSEREQWQGHHQDGQGPGA